MEPQVHEEIADGLAEEERKRAKGGQGGGTGDPGDVSDVANTAQDGAGWCDGPGGCSAPDGCDGNGMCDGPGLCDCDLPGCDCLLLVRLSALLALAALLVPRRDAGLAAALIRLYRRRLTRFTPACPSTPSCSAFALAAVEALGPRRGLAAAARRVRGCGGQARRARSMPSTTSST